MWVTCTARQTEDVQLYLLEVMGLGLPWLCVIRDSLDHIHCIALQAHQKCYHIIVLMFWQNLARRGQIACMLQHTFKH